MEEASGVETVEQISRPRTCFEKFSEPIRRLLRRSKIALTVYAFIAGFACYFSMYGFRKPFSVYDYPNMYVWGIEFKIFLITVQVIGYMISKFLGIKVVSELGKRYRGLLILAFIGAAELALILFGATPAPYNAIFMFINGLPLGMIWGLVFSFLEGRRTSEILGSGMCVSFIVSSGVVKSVGQAILNKGYPPFWMPAIVGAIFAAPLVVTVIMLECIPEPDEEDVRLRTVRVSMSGAERLRFLRIFWPGVLVMTVFYMLLTAFRDFRDNFAPELWAAFGYPDAPSVFSVSELAVAIAVCVPIGLFMLIRGNIYVMVAYHILILCGQILLGAVAALYHADLMSGLPFMILTGIGLYVGYVPFNSIIFDVMLAAFEYHANSGFLMYVCDSMGYLASVIILFVKNFAVPDLSWRNFYIYVSYGMAVIGTVLMALSGLYYFYKYRRFLKTRVPLSEAEDEIVPISETNDVDDADVRISASASAPEMRRDDEGEEGEKDETSVGKESEEPRTSASQSDSASSSSSEA